jgi:hypothetical protein
MASFFKYAERNVDSQINWSEVGKNVVDMLREEDRLREEKKAAIDEASRQFGETLANAPTGDFKSANEWILGYAADASQARLMQDRLLKSGMLKVKDYTVMRQNLNDGTNQMFQVAKEYQSHYQEVMSRMKNNESQDIESFIAQQVEGLSNFKNTKAYINPTNFSVSLAGMKKEIIDGKEVMVMDNNPDNYVSVNQLRNRLNSRFDRYQYVDAINTQVEALGEFQTADISRVAGLYKMARVTDVLDPTNRTRLSDEDKKTITAYQEWETNMIGAQLSNPLHISSLLTNAIDKVPGTQDFYEPTFDAELAKTNKKYILLKDDGTGNVQPVFTEEQTKVATEFLRAQTRNALDRKVNIQVTAEPQVQYAPSYVYERGDKVTKDADMGNMIGKFYSGNEGQINAARSWLLATPGVTFVDRKPSGLIVTKDGVTKTFPFQEDGKKTSYDDFVAALGRFVDQNVDMNAMRRGAEKGAGGKVLNTTYETSGRAEQMNVDAEFKNYVGSLFNAEKIKGLTDSESSAVNYFNGIIGSIPGLTGYKATGDGSFDPSSDGVLIKDAKGNQVLEFRFDAENETSSQEYIQSLVDLAVANSTAEQRYPIAKTQYDRRKAEESKPKPKPKPAPGKGKYDN